MIQRIQTIFLTLAAIAAGVLLLLPFANTEEAVASSSIFNDRVFNINDHIGLMAAFLIAGLLCLVAIFVFKNRKLQMGLSIAALLATLVGLGIGLFFFFNDSASAQATTGLGTLMPALMIVFILLARRGIKKDEKLVRSMDRLR